MIQIFTLEPSKSVHNGEFQPPIILKLVVNVFSKKLLLLASATTKNQSV